MTAFLRVTGSLWDRISLHPSRLIDMSLLFEDSDIFLKYVQQTDMTRISPDYLEAGKGQKVILIHSSVAGARQWHSLMKALADRFHLIAINLYGYGGTKAWPNHRTQTLGDQAELLESFLENGSSEQVNLVGHSFGGSVAMKAAEIFGDKISRLVLIEPNPFYILKQHDRYKAFQEAVNLRDIIKSNGENGTWETAAEKFANYWTGDGSWDAMTEERRSKFTKALKPNFHEWDAVMNEDTVLSVLKVKLPEKTTVLSANDTVYSIAQIISLMKESIKSWNYAHIEHGGHMAVMTKPDILNPMIESALSD